MPKLTGLFDEFQDPEGISIENVAANLSRHEDLKLLENEFGNKILYSHSVPVTNEERMFEQSIVMESLKIDPGVFYSPQVNIINIPEKYYYRYKDYLRMVMIFLESIKPKNITSLMLKIQNDGTKSLGTYIRPEIKEHGAIELFIDGTRYYIETGKILQLHQERNHVEIRIDSKVATIFGQQSYLAEVKGGQLGIIIDTRF